VSPAVALLNYISCGTLWRIFCHTGIFHGVFSTAHIIIKTIKKWRKKTIKWYNWGQLVTKGHKNTNAALILKIWEIIFCFWANYFMGHFEGYFEGPRLFWPSKLSRALFARKKIISRIFKISGALTVILNPLMTAKESGTEILMRLSEQSSE
jgi:hypothetical protein